jgi:hypothetical protein
LAPCAISVSWLTIVWMRRSAVWIESSRSLSTTKSSSDETFATWASRRFRLLTITSRGLLISCASPIATSPSVTSWSRRRISRGPSPKPIDPARGCRRRAGAEPAMTTGMPTPLFMTKVVSQFFLAHRRHHLASLVEVGIEARHVLTENLVRRVAERLPARRRCRR